jgi:hypothetical protein
MYLHEVATTRVAPDQTTVWEGFELVMTRSELRPIVMGTHLPRLAPPSEEALDYVDETEVNAHGGLADRLTAIYSDIDLRFGRKAINQGLARNHFTAVSQYYPTETVLMLGSWTQRYLNYLQEIDAKRGIIQYVAATALELGGLLENEWEAQNLTAIHMLPVDERFPYKAQ